MRVRRFFVRHIVLLLWLGLLAQVLWMCWNGAEPMAIFMNAEHLAIITLVVRVLQQNIGTLLELQNTSDRDRSLRERALAELAARTSVVERQARDLATQTAERVDSKLESISTQIDMNTEMTSKAASASAEAAEVANRVNEKIADTNKRVEELHETIQKGTGAYPVSVLTQPEETIAHNTESKEKTS